MTQNLLKRFRYFTFFLILLMASSAFAAAPRAIFSFGTDDGFRTFNTNLAELFKSYGYRFTLAIITHPPVADDKLSAAEVKQLDADGFEIAGHSDTHFYPLTPREAFSLRLDAKDPNAHAHRYLVGLDVTSEQIAWSVNEVRTTFEPSTMAQFVATLNQFFTDNQMPLKASLYDASMGSMSSTTLASQTAIAGNAPLTFFFQRGWSTAELKEEISRNKAWLEQLLGHPILTFVYPFGSCPSTTINLVKGCGYQLARGTLPGPQVEPQPKLLWAKVYGGTDYNLFNAVSPNRDYRSLQGRDFYRIPINQSLGDLMLSLQRGYRLKEITKSDIQSQLTAFVQQAKARHQLVILLDHDGSYQLWMYQILLDILKADSQIAVLPLGQAYEAIMQQ